MTHIDHPLPPEEARQRGQRRAASDGAQAAIWFTFLAVVTLLVAVGVAWGLSQRLSPQAPDVRPALPSLPGQQPVPQQP